MSNEPETVEDIDALKPCNYCGNTIVPDGPGAYSGDDAQICCVMDGMGISTTDAVRILISEVLDLKQKLSGL
jgi:hypothetical protein